MPQGTFENKAATEHFREQKGGESPGLPATVSFFGPAFGGREFPFLGGERGLFPGGDPSFCSGR